MAFSDSDRQTKQHYYCLRNQNIIAIRIRNFPTRAVMEVTVIVDWLEVAHRLAKELSNVYT